VLYLIVPAAISKPVSNVHLSTREFITVTGNRQNTRFQAVVIMETQVLIYYRDIGEDRERERERRF